MTRSPAQIESHAATFRDCFDHLRTQIGLVFVGQASLVDQMLISFFCQGHVLLEGPARTRQDPARSYARRSIESDVLEDPVHARPDAGRCDRNEPAGRHTGRAARVLVSARTNLRQRGTRRRVESRHATHAVGVSRGNAGAACHGLRDDAHAGGTVHPLRHAESHRDGGHVSVPGGAARSFLLQADRAHARSRRTCRDHGPHDRRAHAPGSPRSSVRRQCSSMSASSSRSRWPNLPCASLLRIVRATHPETDDAPAIVKKYVRYGASPRAAQAIILGVQGAGAHCRPISRLLGGRPAGHDACAQSPHHS